MIGGTRTTADPCGDGIVDERAAGEGCCDLLLPLPDHHPPVALPGLGGFGRLNKWSALLLNLFANEDEEHVDEVLIPPTDAGETDLVAYPPPPPPALLLLLLPKETFPLFTECGTNPKEENDWF